MPPGLGFRFERDLNADGQPDLVLLGRYMLGGSKQTFALIATRNNGPWQRVALLRFERDFIVGELSETRPNEPPRVLLPPLRLRRHDRVDGLRVRVSAVLTNRPSILP